MKKLLLIVLITIGAFFIVSIFLGQTGILKVYKNPTTSNEPNLKINSKMLVSNLVKPKRGDFVCYEYQDEMLGKHIRVHRISGIEHDIIEIRNGILHLNGENVDEGVDYVHSYKLTKEEYQKVKDLNKINENSFVSIIDQNMVMVSLEGKFARSSGLTENRMIESKGKTNERIGKLFNKDWNKDNFGPLAIPQGKIFVLGDNRDNSEDSRFIGLIDVSNIVGVVVKNKS